MSDIKEKIFFERKENENEYKNEMEFKIQNKNNY